MLEGNTFSQLSPVKILTEGGGDFGGSGLARDWINAVILINRGACIASKPAPTDGVGSGFNPA